MEIDIIEFHSGLFVNYFIIEISFNDRVNVYYPNWFVINKLSMLYREFIENPSITP